MGPVLDSVTSAFSVCFCQSLVEVESLDEADEMFDFVQGELHLLLTSQDGVLGLHALLQEEEEQQLR